MINNNNFIFWKLLEEEKRPIAPSFTEYLHDVVLKEGKKCTLRARVTGSPKPHITWFKDGIPIQSTNDDYKVKSLVSNNLIFLLGTNM